MFTYFINCSDCYVLPSIVMNLEIESVTQPTLPMMNSLQGVLIEVDLCLSKSRKLFFTVNAQGQPPFQANMLGRVQFIEFHDKINFVKKLDFT